jgi:hypothetical protein
MLTELTMIIINSTNSKYIVYANYGTTTGCTMFYVLWEGTPLVTTMVINLYFRIVC